MMFGDFQCYIMGRLGNVKRGLMRFGDLLCGGWEMLIIFGDFW